MNAAFPTQPPCVADAGTWCATIYKLTDSDLLARSAEARGHVVPEGACRAGIPLAAGMAARRRRAGIASRTAPALCTIRDGGNVRSRSTAAAADASRAPVSGAAARRRPEATRPASAAQAAAEPSGAVAAHIQKRVDGDIACRGEGKRTRA